MPAWGEREFLNVGAVLRTYKAFIGKAYRRGRQGNEMLTHDRAIHEFTKLVNSLRLYKDSWCGRMPGLLEGGSRSTLLLSRQQGEFRGETHPYHRLGAG